MKRQRILRNASLMITFMCLSLLLSPARAGESSDDSVGASSVNKVDGASTISVSVSYTSVSNGGGGSGGGATCSCSSLQTTMQIAACFALPPHHRGSA